MATQSYRGSQSQGGLGDYYQTQNYFNTQASQQIPNSYAEFPALGTLSQVRHPPSTGFVPLCLGKIAGVLAKRLEGC